MDGEQDIKRAKETFVQLVSFQEYLSESLARHETGSLRPLSPYEQEVVTAVTERLDKVLGHLVTDLERAAQCQIKGLVPLGERDSLPPLEAFCLGFQRVGEAQLSELFAAFHAVVAAHHVPSQPLAWTVLARGEALTAYLIELAQVHGIAGASDRSGSAPVMALRQSLNRFLTQQEERLIEDC